MDDDSVRWAESAPIELTDLVSRSGCQPLSDAPIALPGLSHVTVMMVDDEPMMTEVIRTYLEEAGYHRFVSVNDPALAVEAVRRHRPGLLLLDLMMPGLSGFDILEQMRRDAELRYVSVIVLTASSDVANKLRALELGAIEFLSKPVDASELVLRVRNSLAFKVYQDRLVNEDLLTALPNRRAFVGRLQSALARAEQSARSVALLHIGLDRFRQVNDTLGHGVGDGLLRAVAQRLESCTRRHDDLAQAERLEDAASLSRIGGDEFTLLLPGLANPEAAGRVARRVLAVMNHPFKPFDADLFVTPSIGIAVYPNDGLDAEAILRGADAAMAHAKASGRNTYRFYSRELNNVSLERLTLGNQLRRAIERDEFMLHFQPKVDLASGRIVGAEALLRWNHPDLGPVPPDRFISIAEESGLIVEIGEWVIRQVCAQLAEWHAVAPDIKVAVNVSRHEMTAGGLVRTTEKAMRRHGIARGRLVMELTESLLMDRVGSTRQQLEELRALGIELSIDDFGTGYSSMNYLRRFPLDELKIDRSFVAGTPDDKTDTAIVRAIVALAHGLGMRVVAEGVETQAQREMLRAIACDAFQGFLCSRPLAPRAFIAKTLEINGAIEAPLTI